MEAVFGQIALGLLTETVFSVFAPVVKRGGMTLLSGPMCKAPSPLETTLRQAAATACESMEWVGPPREEIACLFLGTPSCQAAVRQLYASSLIHRLGNQEEITSIPIIREQFVTSFSMYVEQSIDYESGSDFEVRGSAARLFEELLRGCEKIMDAAINCGVLAAHEARSDLRFRILHDEIEGVAKALAYLNTDRPNIPLILNYERTYRAQLGQRYELLRPPNVDGGRNRPLPMGELYVSPRFDTLNQREADDARSLALQDFMSSSYRTVVLGNPGAGKSTLAQRLCYDLATGKMGRLFGMREVTPILVVLREYGAAHRDQGASIVDHITAKASSSLQSRPPDGAFEYLLLNGRALVIFDGLDELLDSSDRRAIADAVESFCNLYPSVPVLVTSREVGYDQAPLDERRFEAYRLAPFDDNQVREYVKKWFDAETDWSTDDKEGKVESFLAESETVPDLRSNPLMLSLLCNIYRGENYIPSSRPEVYEKCALMLFDRWDRSRGLGPTLQYQSHLNPTMKYLAHWIYADPRLREGVTEQQLVTAAASYLSPSLITVRDEAETIAREFVEFCRGRAWVFTDTGLTGYGEPLYQFTHQTFLEYFTAAYLVRIHRTPEPLLAILRPRIERQE